MSTPEIITVNSESLEATIRDLLPSQNGFGSELQASNVIMPIIDLTATAEGSVLRADLQSALSFTDATAFYTTNTTDNLVASPGFYRVTAGSTVIAGSPVAVGNNFQITDGSSTKVIWRHQMVSDTGAKITALQFDFIVFLTAGDTLQVVSNSTQAQIGGSTRQVASVTGVLTNPSGFVAE
tara:strand:- start:7 stop:549 length:543 start_codon:yes stop_codon:yes gene_type:complete